VSPFLLQTDSQKISTDGGKGAEAALMAGVAKPIGISLRLESAVPEDKCHFIESTAITSAMTHMKINLLQHQRILDEGRSGRSW